MPHNPVAVSNPFYVFQVPRFVGGSLAGFLEKNPNEVACRETEHEIKQTPILFIVKSQG